MPRKPPGGSGSAAAPAIEEEAPGAGLRLFGIRITAPAGVSHEELRRLGETRSARRAELSKARFAVIEAESALKRAEEAAEGAERAFAAAVQAAFP
jgi:hypothetical protein